MNISHVCCFTGHRRLKNTNELKAKLINILESLINQGSTKFYAGGAMGFDMLAEETIINLRIKYPQIKLYLILPCSAEEQTAKWNDAEKGKYNQIMAESDGIEFISEHYYKGCMKARNAGLIELSDICVCYYNEKNSASGTGQTVRMAERKGINIINIFN